MGVLCETEGNRFGKQGAIDQRLTEALRLCRWLELQRKKSN